MEYRRIAGGQLEVSTVCLGCWAIVGDATWGPQDKADALAAIRASIEAGVNFMDTAELYGDGASERLLREAIGADRDRVVIASKVASEHVAAADVVKACEGSLANLGTDYLDIYHIHWPSRTVPFDQTVRAIEGLIESGKVRHLAVSNFGAADLAEILPLAEPAANQLAYNLLFRAAEYDILPACRAAGVPVTCYGPLMQGLLTGKFACADDVPAGRARTRIFSHRRPGTRHGQAGAEGEAFAAVAEIAALARAAGMDMGAMCLAWLLRQEGVASVIAGARNADQARRNAAAGNLTLPDDLAARLGDITQPTKSILGANADMWQSDSRIR